MDYTIEYQNLFGKIQEHVVEILSDDELLKEWGVPILSENINDIDFQIRNAMSRQGVMCLVTTMKGTYGGHNSMVESWLIDNLEILVVENTTINRPRMKKNNLEYGTGTDISYRIFETLGGPQSGHFGTFCPKTFEVGEDGGLVVSKCRFSCQFNNHVDGIVEKETNVKIPFVTHIEIDGLIAEIDSLKRLIEGFDTEEIKADVNELKDETSSLSSRIDGLDQIYQPVGDYALKTDIPTHTNQLINNSGYLTSVSWNEIKNIPDIALKTDIPKTTSNLINDSGFITSVSWDDISNIPNLALKSEIPTKTSNLINDSGFIRNVYWNDIISKPNLALLSDIPTRTSSLINDSGYLTAVDWSDISNIPDFVTSDYLDEKLSNYPDMDSTMDMIDYRISNIHIDDQPTKLWSESKMQYIKGTLDVWKQVAVPGHWTDWTYSDSEEHTMEMDQYSEGQWRWLLGPENVYVLFGSREQAEEASSVQFEISIGQYVTATRTWVEPTNIWKHIDDVAKVSQIPTRTSLLTNDSGFINETLLTRTLEDYITHSESQDIIDRIPTRTSQLINDSGYLTSFPNLDQYASKQYVDSRIASETAERKEADIQFDSRLNLKADKSSVPTRTSQLENDAMFLSEVSWDIIADRPNIEGMASTEYVDNQVSSVQSSISTMVESKSPVIRRWTI